MTRKRGRPKGGERRDAVVKLDIIIVGKAQMVAKAMGTSLAEYLVTQGIPFRTAHHIVGTLVARCEKEGNHALSQLSVDAFNEVISASTNAHGASSMGFRVTDDVYTCLGAANVVKRYQSAGAAGGKPFEEQLAAWKKRLGM